MTSNIFTFKKPYLIHMDASKLYNIIFDLNLDSNSSEVTTLLQTLVIAIAGNDSKGIITTQKELTTLLNDSIVNTYAPSNLEILEFIGGKDYFGDSALSKVLDILNNNSYDVLKIVDDLNVYIIDREAFLKIIDVTKDNLKSLNIKAHYHKDSTFEIGLLMPRSLTLNKITNVTKELNRWDKVIKTFKELTEGENEDTEITFISNGSLQFFIDNTPHVAMCLALAIERIAKLYKNILDIRETREKLKKLGVSPIEQKSIEKQEKEIFNKEIDKISADIIKGFAQKQIETGRLNELKIAVKGHVTYIGKCIDNGLVIEITPPEADEDVLSKGQDNPEAPNNPKLSYDKVLKQIEIVQKSMATVKEIGKTGVDMMKYLSIPQEDDDPPIEN